MSAITLVFGTERRGVDIPQVDPQFETNVPGVFIVGELGGMGLIRKAALQGRQAVSTIAARKRGTAPYDVVIVGAGPAGIAAGLGAVEAKLRYVLIEQEPDLGGSVFHFPRNKIAMTAPVDLPLVGKMKFTEVSKEALLEFWKRIIGRTGVQIRFGERMDALEAGPNGHRVVTATRAYETTAVVLAIGRRGTPRTLGVPGESLPKVIYRLVDAEQYRGQRVLVVGGGDSAVEAALACAAESGTEVTIAYRGEVFNRLKPANRERLAQAEAAATAPCADANRGRTDQPRSRRPRHRRQGGVDRQRCGHRAGRRRAADRPPAPGRHRIRDEVRHGLTPASIGGII